MVTDWSQVAVRGPRFGWGKGVRVERSAGTMADEESRMEKTVGRLGEGNEEAK